MDFKELRITQTSGPTKVAVLILLFFQVAVGLACATLALGVDSQEVSALLQAASYALGVGVPLLVVALVLLSSRSAASAIQKKTEELLLKTVPAQLSLISFGDWVSEERFIEYQGRQVRPEKPKADPVGSPKIYVQYKPGASAARYRITAKVTGKEVQLYFSIDLAVNQVSVFLSVLADALKPPNADLKKLCNTTLEGAKVSGGYAVDDAVRDDTFFGKQYKTIILRKKFGEADFLWDDTGKHFFAVDLRFMVSDFILRCKDVLESTPAAPAASAA